jgi:lysophospholipase L1-like esterase
MLLISIVFLPDHYKSQTKNPKQEIAPTPTPFNPFPYKPPKIPYSRSYLTMLVGDSMVASLGPNANLLRQHLIELYPAHEFVNYNYGFGSTNIETLPERLTKDTVYKGQNFPAILSQGFNLIIIESFAYNPLSETEESDDTSKHIQVLDASIRQIIKTHPESVVAIMATIAPNKNFFAKGVYALSKEERIRWVQERVSYIEAVIKYSREKEIPLINVYEKSLTPTGDGNLKYINPDDYIHPSAEGVDLISRTIADYIFSEKLFPE